MGWLWSYRRNSLCFLISLAAFVSGAQGQRYYGSRIGALSELQHLVKGDVYAVDSRTIHIRGFSYDGTAPDAFFYAGESGRPSDAGFIIPDENGGVKPLGRYRNKDITLTLPDGKTFRDIRWFSVWCRAFAIDFGSLQIPSNMDYPRPQKIDALPTLEHGVSSDRIVVVDAQTFLIPNFSYDGAAPDGHFWVGKGTSPGPKGTIVPDENGSEEPLKRYSSKTIVITLPGDLTVFDIDFLSVWCRAFFADFGHVRIPKNLNVPPSLKMLGVAPQTKLNCEVLWDDLAFEVRWAVAGESIVMQLVGRITDGQYMAFGPSGTLTRSVMIGGDVVVAWLDQATGRGEAKDYHLNAKAQCQGGRGACPDDKITGSSNNVRLLNAALINDFTMLTFQRPLRAGDQSDIGIQTNGSQAVIWAIGPVNSQGDTSYHTLRSRGDLFMDFGRTPRWNCPLPEEQGSNTDGSVRTSSGPNTPPPATAVKNPWFIPPIPCHEPADGVFYAQIGPTGGDNGYNAITGHVGWGISWYINGLLIPEINVVRGKTYTFVVEGGFDPENTARYHPFYITDDPEGGYEFKTPAERNRIRVFAGVGQDRDGTPVPSAYGRLCEWNEDPNQPAGAFQSFGAYQRTLSLNCQEGQPGILQWTPDQNTPNTVYYQCYTHRFLGWKINVLDHCDSDQFAAGSINNPTVVSAPQPDYAYYEDYYDGPQPDSTQTGLLQGNSAPNDFNRIPNPDFGKPKRRPDTRPIRPVHESFPDHFGFPDFSHDFPSGFESFPFDMEKETFQGPVLRRPVRPNAKPSQPPPLGAPGFTFPKLPSLKSPTSIIAPDAFAKLGSKNDSSPDISETFKDDFDFSGAVNIPTRPMTNLYPQKPEEDIPDRPMSNRFPLKPGNATSTVKMSTEREKNITPLPKFSTSLSSTTSEDSTSQTDKHLTTSRVPSKPRITLNELSTKAPFHQLTQSLRFSTPLQTSPFISSQSVTSTLHHQTTPSTSSSFPFLLTRSTTTKQPVTVVKYIPTRKPVYSGQVEASKQTTQFTVTNTQKLSSKEYSRPSREPEVITAPSLPRLPGQVTSTLEISPPVRYPSRYTSPLPKPTAKSQNLGTTFAQNFGFDPDSVIFESDFKPVKKRQPGSSLAFEVSSLDANPVRIPLPPRPPRWSSQRRPAGPRTSGPFEFSHRIIKVNEETKNDVPKSPAEVGTLPHETLDPIFHPSINLNEKFENQPIPLPIAMGPVVPLLGGGASNMPLKPNNAPQIIHRSNNFTHRHIPVRPPPVSINRSGKPQGPWIKLPERRLVSSHIPLPDNHPVPVPQLVGFLKPLLNSPLENDDLTAAASAQVFASDGRRLSPDSVPRTPQLPSRPRRPSHQITNRPQVVPYRGSLPPPIPSKVPPLAQFRPQRRPFSRPVSVAPPPLDDDFLSPGRLSPQASHPRPVIASRQDVPLPAASMLPQHQLSAEIGVNQVISVSQKYPTTAEAYAPARSLTTQKINNAAPNSDKNLTRINILKDVWAILTKEDPDLKSEHPRDDAHPDHGHDHLDRKRKRRETESTNSSSRISLSVLAYIGILHLLYFGR